MRARILVLAGLFAACAPGGPGPEHERGRAPATEAERVVQAQVDAYNRRDLDAFMATLHPDAQLYIFPDSLWMAGSENLRRTYGSLFARATSLRAEVLQRVVQGNYVIDREVTYGLGADGPHTGVAIYEVRNGRIARVWFMD